MCHLRCPSSWPDIRVSFLSRRYPCSLRSLSSFLRREQKVRLTTEEVRREGLRGSSIKSEEEGEEVADPSYPVRRKDLLPCRSRLQISRSTSISPFPSTLHTVLLPCRTSVRVFVVPRTRSRILILKSFLVPDTRTRGRGHVCARRSRTRGSRGHRREWAARKRRRVDSTDQYHKRLGRTRGPEAPHPTFTVDLPSSLLTVVVPAGTQDGTDYGSRGGTFTNREGDGQT